jgi:hypothetical protein
MPGQDDAEEDLRSTAESIRDDAQRLTEIEEEKAGSHPRSGRTRELSEEGVEIASRLRETTRVERDLAQRITTDEEPRGRLN